MITVAGQFRIPEGKQDALLPHARQMLAATRAEEGCILYAFAFDLEDPHLVRVYEEWESWEHLAAHGEAPHMAQWRAALGEIGSFERAVKAYEAGQAKTV
ncbi:putative quinol monooxygenase [Afifella pfennigii]|uniref:putative quinol monooxygenase n=1 Tax=Afifella pfennigii TaxID=209897 RepID=UPI000478EE62|nr:putative quinol monooxygenase [Afifella pfennigii]